MGGDRVLRKGRRSASRNTERLGVATGRELARYNRFNEEESVEGGKLKESLHGRLTGANSPETEPSTRTSSINRLLNPLRLGGGGGRKSERPRGRLRRGQPRGPEKKKARNYELTPHDGVKVGGRVNNVRYTEQIGRTTILLSVEKRGQPEQGATYRCRPPNKTKRESFS